MKKVIFTFLLLFVAMINGNYAKAKGGICQKGEFLYEYKVEKEGVWLTKITPLSSKGIGTLNIPSKLDRKPVVKLGGSGDAVNDLDDNGDDTNLFGVFTSEEDRAILPKNIQSKVKKIKTIKIPSTVNIITQNCFKNIPDGTSINIPEGVTENVRVQFTRVKWDKIEVSAKNKKYKVENGCLLSKNGKILYGFVQKRKKIVIPGTVKRIAWGGGDYNGCSTIVIPKGVNKIEKNACSTDKAVTVKIAKGNKRYAVKYGSVYSKVSGRLVLGYVKDGILKIPEEVTRIDENGFLGLGERLNKVIIPSSVTEIHSLPWQNHGNTGNRLTCEIQCKTPPKLISSFSDILELAIYVPKNCKDKYLKEWKFDPYVKVTIMEQ